MTGARGGTVAGPGPRRVSGAVLAVLAAGLAAFMAWLVLGHRAMLPWRLQWYLPLHTVVETLAVVVITQVFSTGGHGTGRRIPARVALLSPAALAVALLEFGHLMSVPGMPGLIAPAVPGSGVVFSLAARLLGALTLLAAVLVPRERMVARSVHALAMLAALAAVGAGYWLVLAAPGLVPATHVAGVGPTAFKTACEYLLIAINGVAALLSLGRALRHGRRTDRYLALAAAVMALAGVAFVFSMARDDAVSMVGHLYEVIAYLFLYRAIHVAAVQAPYLRLKRSERSLAESESNFRSLMECAPDAILLAAPDGRIAMMNARAEELFGIGRDSAAGLALDVLLPGAGADGQGDVVECRRLRQDPFPAEVRRAATPAGQQIAIVRDLSERSRLERALLEQLTYDALTGLPNRRRILETLDEAIDAARQERRTLAVLVLDLDEFRKINSGYGWAGGDEVLRECVTRLAQMLESGDTLARQGGNEFIVVQKHSGQDAAGALGARLLGAMREPFVLGGQRVFLSASIGVALLPEAPCGAAGLLQMAQVAMGGARAAGPAHLRFHSADMEQAIRDRVDMEAMLRHALEHGQLALQYQPRIGLEEGRMKRMVGVEALVRWRHPVLGLVPPARFIPLAEETGMIEELDLWVLRTACARAAAWHAAGLPLGRVSVNLSARQFQHPGLAQRVRAALEDSGLHPAHLEIEITESTVMRDTEVAAGVLRSLKALGVALSIDDFGTGYSSLSYLKQFPIDVLKIDRSFVKDVVIDANDAAITRAIIALAHGLNLEAVAEGVETAEQMAFLQENGCDEIQGFYFSRPLWPEQLEAFMAREAPQPTT
ncbi:EAL domain-containing protein [Massilia forsythiae]|uniref:EAL domain-containing protein n=1 Tax=Massilia forsythiae TaxID=2728020 RepID=A0A7Z2VWZ0_9BURK|nr:EAL domain-containing protein [Massilia forsythiae]QJE00917.1 EAL domain-containing protein [Massilia forsythiae]